MRKPLTFKFHNKNSPEDTYKLISAVCQKAAYRRFIESVSKSEGKERQIIKPNIEPKY
ncbi:MAG: hypothetical protein LBL98_02250 [Ruminococcus sp.]|nr:hypothetical protein [Ruminococcus sp.]